VVAGRVDALSLSSGCDGLILPKRFSLYLTKNEKGSVKISLWCTVILGGYVVGLTFPGQDIFLCYSLQP